jgi:two-component system OmpR family sensor kinase
MITPARWSVRARLIAVLVILLAVVGTAVGVVTQLTLQRMLVDQVDEQLTAAAARSAGGSNRPSSG